MRKLLLLLALLGALAAVGAGCGSDEDENQGAPEPAATGGTDTGAADACAKENLPTRAPGTLTIGTDNPAFPPWFGGTPKAPWKVSDPRSGKGYESAVAYTVAKQLGFESIIVDDGWQTLDSRRGYAFTGDWEPERMPDMKGFVDGCHDLGVKVVLWYAVPFMGKNAKAAARFKDKTLRFDDRLGPYVLDPRYPEVRQYLVDTYVRAIRDWGIDGFKLDFIERFVHPDDQDDVVEVLSGIQYPASQGLTFSEVMLLPM